MRLLIISNHLALEDNPESDAFVRERVDGLRASGAKVTVIPIRAVTVAHHGRRALRQRSFERTGWRRPPATHADSTEYVSPMAAWRYVLARRGYQQFAVRSVAARISREVAMDRFDAVIGHGAYGIPAAGVAQELARLANRPYMAVGHGSDINFAQPANVSYLRSVFKSAAGAFFVSDALRRRAIQLGFIESNTHVTPNGVDCSRFPPRLQQRSRLSQVLFVGNLLEVKGADRLPGIRRALDRAGAAHVDLVVVGTGPLRDRLEREMGGQRVTFKGALDREGVAAQMRAADVLLLPSRSEGWPCVVLEAQASGTPVVATDVGGTSEALGECGFLCPSVPFDPMRMVDLALRASEMDRTKTSARARLFDWDVLGEAELALISCLSRK